MIEEIRISNTSQSISPRFSSHLEMLIGEANRNVAFLSLVLDINLKIIKKLPDRSRAIALYCSDIIAMPRITVILCIELIS